LTGNEGRMEKEKKKNEREDATVKLFLASLRIFSQKGKRKRRKKRPNIR